jgi:hypothetical protein
MIKKTVKSNVAGTKTGATKKAAPVKKETSKAPVNKKVSSVKEDVKETPKTATIAGGVPFADVNKALKLFTEGMTILTNALSSDADTKEVAKTDKVSTTKQSASKAKEKEEKAPVDISDVSVEDLDTMEYNDMKALASSLGVESRCGKEELRTRLRSALNGEDTAEESEDEDTAEDEENDIQSQVEKEVADLSDAEITDILKEAGIPVKGKLKRQALIAKVVEGVESGKIDMTSDDEEEEGSEDESEGDFSEEDPFFAEKTMTDERAEKIEALEDELRGQYKKKKLTDKQIDEFLKHFKDTPAELLNGFEYDAKASKDDKLDSYILLQYRLVDDAGELHELEDPYEVNEQNACCGTYLAEAEGLVCQVCGTEYGDEDEE